MSRTSTPPADHRRAATTMRTTMCWSSPPTARGSSCAPRRCARRPARKAQAATTKLKTRLSKGEKRNRKRLAEVGAVYDLAPVPRHATDVMGGQKTGQKTGEKTGRPPAAAPAAPTKAPVATNKWVTASVVDDAAQVLRDVFDEAERRDPTHTRTWVALVDGNNHQINRIETEASDRGIDVTIVVDLIHVLEYLSAPRGALPYPPCSGERLEGISLDLMAYPAPKG